MWIKNTLDAILYLYLIYQVGISWVFTHSPLLPTGNFPLFDFSFKVAQHAAKQGG